MKNILERPTKPEQEMASNLFVNLTSAISKRKSDTARIHFSESEESFIIPHKALEFLSLILSIMAEGKAVAIIPSESELSTQQAADMLGVSRPHIVKLLEQGTIPFKKAGSHRRILIEDVLNYARQQKITRKENLKFLSEQAQELNLGYK